MSPKKWEFPEDVMAVQAMVEALIVVLSRHNLLSSGELSDEYRRRIDEYLKEDQPAPESPREAVSA